MISIGDQVLWMAPPQSMTGRCSLHIVEAENVAQESYGKTVSLAGCTLRSVHFMALSDVVEPTPDRSYILYSGRDYLRQAEIVHTGLAYVVARVEDDDYGCGMVSHISHPGMVKFYSGDHWYGYHKDIAWMVFGYEEYSKLIESRLKL